MLQMQMQMQMQMPHNLIAIATIDTFAISKEKFDNTCTQ